MTHKETGSSAKEQVANGSFIKHKSGIYTVGQKDTSPPSGSRKEKSQGTAPKVREQLNRERGSQVGVLRLREKLTQEPCLRARTLLAGGITMTEEFSLSYTLGP